ncbi:lytic transglycosylase domain-containing protein [Bdellovibrio sp. HCB185ZH]|uniref:lytic transglycosylase domain-containing protein n=1 Tax=Bdellovibrio sp. HCB185ZH TaxID=3394235 RepID=UPI0039A5DBB9
MIKVNLTTKLDTKKKKFTAGFVMTVVALTGVVALYNSVQMVDTDTLLAETSAPVEKSNEPMVLAAADSDAEVDGEVAGFNLEIPQFVALDEDTGPIAESGIVENREEILNDYQNLISEEFHIPENLRDRVGFWFDIYTLHNSNKRLIHHSVYPWIVFEVVDTTDIINSDTPKHRWMRNLKADALVKQQVEKTKTALKSLAKKKNLDDLTDDEARVMEALSRLDGEVKEKAKFALKNIRVQTGQRNFFQEGLEVSPKYLPGMEEIFENYNLPVELTRIPFVESSFNKHAKSKVGASGIWQFMGGTGRKFMVVTDNIDERHSPFKATVAAAQLLKENHMILKRSWPLAITAWNHGPPGIRKGMAKAKSQDLGEIIAKYRTKSFDFASSNFYSEFLGALYAEKYHEEAFKDLNYSEKLNLHTVKLSRSINAKELLRRSKLSEDNFMLFNPDLKKAVRVNAQVPSGFTLMLDDDARDQLKGIVAKATLGKKRKVPKSTTASSEVSLSEPVARDL